MIDRSRRRFRPRLTVRWLMVAVAIVGMIFGVIGLMERRRAIDRLWDLHALNGMTEQQDGFGRWRSKKTDYHRALAEKYRRASQYPWLPIAPDPPEPTPD